MASLVNGLGGSAGFGESMVPAGDFWNPVAIDISDHYHPLSGLKYLSGFFSGLWVSSAGFVIFEREDGNRINASVIPLEGHGGYSTNPHGASTAPVLAPYWAPINTSLAPLAASPGGTSTGTNKVWYDLDVDTGVVTVTWDDVRPFNGGGFEIDVEDGGVAAFQLQILPASGTGATAIDFDVIFRYEHLDWGPFTSTVNGRDAPRALLSDFFSVRNNQPVFTEPLPSAATTTNADGVGGVDSEAIFGMLTESNTGQAGVWRFAYRQGWVTAEASVADATVVEGTGAGATFAAVTVSLEAGVDYAFTLTWQALSGDGLGTATLASDLLSTLTGSITFDAWERVKTIFVPIARDANVEGDDTFTLRLSGPSLNFQLPGGVVLLDRDAVVTIQDDDGPTLSIADAAAVESTGRITFTVTRSSGTGVSSADYVVTAETATAGTDFTAISGTVTFAAGETTRTITVAVAADAVVESDETFIVTLSNPVNATFADALAFGTIVDDTTLIEFGVANPGDAQVIEPTIDDLTIRMRASRSGADLGLLAVDWVLVGEAMIGVGGVTAADFVGGVLPSGTIVFAAGQTEAFFDVTVLGDTVHEASPEMARFRILNTLPVGTSTSLGTLIIDDADTDLGWIRGTPGVDVLFGNAGNDSIDGLASNDSLAGRDGDDWLVGGAGNDELRGGAGADVIHGGTGNDNMTGDGGDDTLAGGAGNDIIRGGGGRDLMEGGDGADVIGGNVGDDDLRGGIGNDTLDGDDGADTLDGGDGRDVLNGGVGNDQLAGGAGNDLLNGGAGNDALDGGTGADQLLGSAGDDVIAGGAGADSALGGDGADTMFGGTEQDLLRGDAGDDVLNGEEDGDRLFGGDGSDSLSGDAGNDAIYGGAGADTALGGDGDDFLLGQDDADRLFGGAGRDVIAGGAGNDTIEGGLGADRLLGEAGADVFRWIAVAESVAQGSDTVEDFVSGTDRLDVSAIDADVTTAGDQAFVFIGTGAFTGGLGVAQIRVQVIGPSTWLMLDTADADANADGLIRLVGAPTVLAGDLIL